MIIIFVIIILVVYYVFIKGNFLEKNLPGSHGNIAKSLIREYNAISMRNPRMNKNKIFGEILADRFIRNKCMDYAYVFNAPKEVIQIMDGNIVALTFLVCIVENKTIRQATLYRGNNGVYGLEKFLIPVMEVCRDNSFPSKHSLDELIMICVHIRSIINLYR